MQSTSQAPSSTPQTPNRRYDLDWLRVIAIITLLFYHTGMIYVSWGWHIKSAEHSQPMEEVMRWLHRWRMPLLFFISGAGTYFALQRRSYGTYAGERFRRLFVPLVFGLFRGRFTDSYLDFYPNVFEFHPYETGGTGGAFSWHHLWFVLYLFLYSLLSIPLFRWLQSEEGQRFTDRVGRLIDKPGSALWLAVPLLINDVILGGFFPRETNALIDDWATFGKYLLLFWGGYLLTSRRAFWQLITDQRRIFLAATLVCTVFYYGSRVLFGADIIDTTVLSRTLFSFNSLCMTWFSVLATIGYGHRYLNYNHSLLSHLTEAVYPFYILHQTAIVVIGFWFLKNTSLGVYSGFLVISLLSGLVSVGIYWFLIRPFRVMRLLFGVK
jgi:glucans biosynthesis protein C